MKNKGVSDNQIHFLKDFKKGDYFTEAFNDETWFYLQDERVFARSGDACLVCVRASNKEVGFHRGTSKVRRYEPTPEEEMEMIPFLT